MCEMANEDLGSASVVEGKANGADSSYTIETSDKGFHYNYEITWRAGKIISAKQTLKKGKNL